jgi:8-oxo-dGTP pyrophosphatase MutT (NUDIX family)/phosphohistidine phosphatase SixA
MKDDKTIVAAGAVVWRRNQDDMIEIALIHRVKYDDWSLPKGKLEGDEPLIACANREVLEETGFLVRFGPSLGKVSYKVGDIPKSVTYWSAKFLEAISIPDSNEVDEVRWLLIEDAERLLTRLLDKEVLKRFCELDPDTKPLILLRHSKAIEREEWAGEDLDRPLSSLGERQAKKLISNFAPFAIEEIHSSSAVRCYETITPMARELKTDFFFTDSLSEYVFQRNADRPISYIHRLLMNDYPTLVCSHNPILPGVVSSFVEKFGIEVIQTKLEPGDAWIVHHIEREVVAIEFLPAPSI